LSEILYPKKVRIEKLFFYLMKLIKGQHESGFKNFPSQRQSRKKFGGKNKKNGFLSRFKIKNDSS